MLGFFRRRDPDAPSGRFASDGEELPNWVLPRGLERLYERPRVRRAIARHFNRAYYYAMQDTIFARRWLGQTTLKYPTDLWVYQEIVAEVRPAVVVETGTYEGGSALFFATLFDALGEGRVISVDIVKRDGLPSHPRVTYLEGSSVDPDVVERVRGEVGDDAPVLVVLDSDHSRDHVLAEMRAYSGLVGTGSYLIAEDTLVNGNPVLPRHGPGPAEAVELFLAESRDFARDPARERMMLTQNPGGFLRRVR